MLLRRLLLWAGHKKLFPQEFFGFVPGRDSTMALFTFIHDVSQARNMHWFVAAVSLDIKAAYDSVDPEILIYKLLSNGIRGKMGRCIAALLTFRFLQVLWSVLSSTCPCFMGVPQGSVLSPFLFLIYLLDIIEVLEEGVFMIVYADDILVYAIGQDEDRARQKLQIALGRITRWCDANKLSLSPDKCSAINFTRRRDPGPPLLLSGWSIPWASPIKVLGIWFTRSLSFKYHFQAIKVKIFKRINYIKATASQSRGINSYHLLRIIHTIIRSSLEYGAPLFFDAPPSSIRTLEVSYNAALRLALGLPRCTPIPVLRREAGVSSIAHRLQLLTRIFLLRVLTAPPDLRLWNILRSYLPNPPTDWKWSSPLHHLQTVSGHLLQSTLHFEWLPPPFHSRFQVLAEGLPFQDPSLPAGAAAMSWTAWFSSLPPCMLLSTDASKDSVKTSIAAVNINSGIGIASLIPHINSVFTAEALALYHALTKFQPSHTQIVILSDSLSVLRALQAWSLKSPKVILFLLTQIWSLSNEGFFLTFVWCPGHRGISPNEQADHLAKAGPFSTHRIPWLSPEDARHAIRKDWTIEIEYDWLSSDYASHYQHLTAQRSHVHWLPNRKTDTLLARWRTRTIFTHNRLFRMNLSFSPLCRHCWDRDSPDHILLMCPYYRSARRRLLQSLQLPSTTSYEEILSTACRSKINLQHFLNFVNNVSVFSA